MDMIFIEILQLNCCTVPELPPSRNPLHNCDMHAETVTSMGNWYCFICLLLFRIAITPISDYVTCQTAVINLISERTSSVYAQKVQIC